MISGVSKKVADRFVIDGVIKAEDKELYRFGVWFIFSALRDIATAVIIGFLFNSILSMLLFAVAFIPIRSYAGGYHAKTPQKCYLISLFMLVSVMLIPRLIHFTDVICIVLLAISSAVIFFLSPTETANKPLDEIELKVYRKRTLLLLTAELLISTVMIAIGFINAAVSIILALCCVGLLLVCGYFVNRESS